MADFGDFLKSASEDEILQILGAVAPAAEAVEEALAAKTEAYKNEYAAVKAEAKNRAEFWSGYLAEGRAMRDAELAELTDSLDEIKSRAKADGVKLVTRGRPAKG